MLDLPSSSSSNSRQSKGKHIMVDENAFSVEHSNVQSNEQNIYENEYEDMLEGMNLYLNTFYVLIIY